MQELNKKSFNHIKVHTQYSICEGAVKIDLLKDFCKENKIKSIGLSDTYNLCGALEFSENISNDDLEKYDAAYSFNITFTYDTRAGKNEEPDPRKPFSCVINNKENLTNFSVKDYLAL